MRGDQHMESHPGVGEDGLPVTDQRETVRMVAALVRVQRIRAVCTGQAGLGAVAGLPTLTAVCTSLAGLGNFAVDCLLGRPLLLFLGKKSGQVPGPSVSGQPNLLGGHNGKWGLALRQAPWEPKAVAGIQKGDLAGEGQKPGCS